MAVYHATYSNGDDLMKKTTCFAAAFVVLLAVGAANAVDLEWVYVGDPGNDPDAYIFGDNDREGAVFHCTVSSFLFSFHFPLGVLQ